MLISFSTAPTQCIQKASFSVFQRPPRSCPCPVAPYHAAFLWHWCGKHFLKTRRSPIPTEIKSKMKSSSNYTLQRFPLKNIQKVTLISRLMSISESSILIFFSSFYWKFRLSRVYGVFEYFNFHKLNPWNGSRETKYKMRLIKQRSVLFISFPSKRAAEVEVIFSKWILIGFKLKKF